MVVFKDYQDDAPNQSPEPTPRAVLGSRQRFGFALPQVGGGSAFFVRCHSHAVKSFHLYLREPVTAPARVVTDYRPEEVAAFREQFRPVDRALSSAFARRDVRYGRFFWLYHPRHGFAEAPVHVSLDCGYLLLVLNCFRRPTDTRLSGVPTPSSRRALERFARSAAVSPCSAVAGLGRLVATLAARA